METDSLPQFPIRTAARRSGLSPHVLRAWEKRYGVIDPARPGGGQRLYSNQDIRLFTLLHRLTESGHSIGRIARLPLAELQALLPSETDDAPPAAASGESTEADRFVTEALSAAMAMDGGQLHRVLLRAAATLSARTFIEAVALPLLSRVGSLWSSGRICPAHEHLVSVQLERVLGWMLDALPVAGDAPAAVATTPAGQRHEFGALIAAVVAAEQGWRVTYLGGDLPAGDIATCVQARGAAVLLLSVVVAESPTPLLPELREIRAGIGEEPHILVGGAAAATLRAEIERSGARCLPDLGALRAALAEIRPGAAA